MPKPPKVTLIKELPPEQLNSAKEIGESEFEALMRNFPPVYFDVRDQSYWFQVGNRILPLKQSSLRSHFLAAKFKAPDGSIWQLCRDGFVKGLNIRQVDWPFYNAEKNHAVDYAGELGGHRLGYRVEEDTGKVYLITKEAKGVFDDLPKVGEPEFFMEFAEQLLPGEQCRHFCHWLAFALRSLRAGDFKPGQACIFAGEAQCGKSLMQYIITQVLGGRASNPFKYMFGQTDFNYDLIRAEHWMFEDPPTATDLKSRREFGERLKECCNNREFRARKMQKDGEMVTIFRRVTGSINKRIEQLSQIPPMYDGTADKLNLYSCESAQKSLRRFMVGAEQSALFGESIPKGQMDDVKIRQTIAAELPVLRSWLLRCFQHVSEPFKADGRMNIRAYHDLELLAAVNSLSYEEKMLALFDSKYWNQDAQSWEGRSDSFQALFAEMFPNQADRIFKGEMDPATVGRYLSEIKRNHPTRISSRKLDGFTIWTILPPSQPQNKKDDNATE